MAKFLNSQNFLGFLLAFVALLLSMASASDIVAMNVTSTHLDPDRAVAGMCYVSGEVGNPDWLNRNIHDICYDIFGGHYTRNGDGRVACYDTGINGPRSYWFEIHNLDRNNGRNLDPEGCITFMKFLSDACPRGGSWIFYDWQFRLDPEHKLHCSEI